MHIWYIILRFHGTCVRKRVASVGLVGLSYIVLCYVGLGWVMLGWVRLAYVRIG
jgi:hypothetical protein